MVTSELASQFGSIENVVALSVDQYTSGSLILMVSYGAHFAFILFFLLTCKFKVVTNWQFKILQFCFQAVYNFGSIIPLNYIGVNRY